MKMVILEFKCWCEWSVYSVTTLIIAYFHLTGYQNGCGEWIYLAWL